MTPLLASLFGKETLIGIDIGSANLKAVQVEAGRDKFRVVRAAQQKTPDNAVREGIVIDRDAVAAALKQMLRAANMSATGAVIAVAGPTVNVRQVQMPRMNEMALRKSVRFEAGKHISMNLDEAAVAFEILGPVEGEPNRMEVMLVAAPSEMIESRIDTVERAGIEAVSVDMEAFALQRAVVDTSRRAFDDGGLRALVDIGATHTEVTILNGASFALTRSIAIAGNAFTETLRNQLRMEPAEAEQRKMETDMGLLLTGGGGFDVAEHMEAARAIQGVLDELLREIRRSINYYQSQAAEGAGAAPVEIILAGGSAQILGLAPYVTARLATETRVVNGFDNPLFEASSEAAPWLSEQGVRLNTALGLAVKEYMHSPLASKA